MSLYIKNEEACRLAKNLSSLTDETMSSAVTVVLRKWLACEQHTKSAPQRLREMRTIAERCSKLLSPGPSSLEHADVLHDDRGLPKRSTTVRLCSQFYTTKRMQNPMQG